MKPGMSPISPVRAIVMATVHGHIGLVDINNISRIHFDSAIKLDEKGYPVCDKSSEALTLIEEKILGRPVDMNEPAYGLVLDPERRKAIKRIEQLFWDRNASAPKTRWDSSPGPSSVNPMDYNSMPDDRSYPVRTTVFGRQITNINGFGMQPPGEQIRAVDILIDV